MPEVVMFCAKAGALSKRQAIARESCVGLAVVIM
jgi:hypothetical protein